MAERERRWSSIDEVIEKARRGIIDDSVDAVPPFGLEDWEIRGEPEPAEASRAGVSRSEGSGTRGRDTPEGQSEAELGEVSSAISPSSITSEPRHATRSDGPRAKRR